MQLIEREDMKTQIKEYFYSTLQITKNKGRGDFIELLDDKMRVVTHAPAILKTSNIGIITGGYIYRKVD